MHSYLRLSILLVHNIISVIFANASGDSNASVETSSENYLYYVEEDTIPKLITPAIRSYKENQALTWNMSSRIFPEETVQIKPVLFEDFINNFNTSFIFLVNFLSVNASPGQQDSQISFHLIKVPIFLQTNVSLNLYTTRFNSSIDPLVLRRNSQHQMAIFLIPINFSIVRKSVGQYFQGHYQSYYYSSKNDIKNTDSSSKDVYYFFGSTSDQQDVDASEFQFEKVIRLSYSDLQTYFTSNTTFGVSTAGNPSWKVFTGALSSQGFILKLFYVCLYCEYRRFHLHELSNWAPPKIKQKIFEITLAGLKYTWIGWYSDTGIDPAGLPYLEEMTSREIMSKPDINLGKILLRFLLTASNYTKFLNYSSTSSSYSYIDDKAIGKAIIITHISTVQQFNTHRVFFDHDSYNFIACNGVKISQHGFAIYFAPFETTIWVSIVLSLIFAPGALSYVLYLRDKRISIFSYFTFLAFALASTFITQYPCGRGETIKLLPFRNAYRCIYGAFLLACLILVNTYVSLIISDITSPLPIRHEFEKVETLEDSLLISPLYEDISAKKQLEYMINKSKIINKTKTGTTQRKRDPYSVVYTPLGYEIYMALFSEQGCHRLISYMYETDLFEQVRKNRTKIPPFCWNLMSLFNQLEPVTDSLHRIGETLSANDCKNKNFYLLLNSEINYKWTQLTSSFENVPFYKGKSTFFNHVKGWKISTFGESKGPMAKRLDTLVSSGIYTYFKRLVEFSDWRRVERISAIKNRNIYQPYALQYAAITFFVFFICHLISVVGFGIEFLIAKSKPMNSSNSYHQYGNSQHKVMFIASNQASSSAYIN